MGYSRYQNNNDKLFGDRPSKDILSVSSLNKLAKSLLETNFPAVVVEGEISNLAIPASGHWYLSLKDKSAQIRCAMFANRNRSTRFKPENGQQVILRGRLSIYEGRGDYQLIVDSMEEAGDGALQRAFEALKARLQDEGLFNESHKKEIKANYSHIGLITSKTGAAVQDMIHVFARRFPSIKLTVFPVSVQGKNAAGEIVTAINKANKLRDKLNLDALILARGGGSLEDLQAFNEEVVARAIFASELPLASAIGHEVDFTIADFVADLRAPTPSAAAEQMSPSQEEIWSLFAGYQQKLSNGMKASLSATTQQLFWLVKRMRRPDHRLQDHSQQLDRLELQLIRAMAQALKDSQLSLSQLQQRTKSASPSARIKEAQLLLKNTSKQLSQSIQMKLQSKQGATAELMRSLNSVSPLNTLARGYSITFDGSDKVIQDAKSLRVGDKLVSQLKVGKVSSVIETIDSESVISKSN